MKTIDVNSDPGEGFGPYNIAPDDQIFPLVTSADIACGAQAGDPVAIAQAVALATEHKVRSGGEHYVR